MGGPVGSFHATWWEGRCPGFLPGRPLGIFPGRKEELKLLKGPQGVEDCSSLRLNDLPAGAPPEIRAATRRITQAAAVAAATGAVGSAAAEEALAAGKAPQEAAEAQWVWARGVGFGDLGPFLVTKSPSSALLPTFLGEGS